MMPHSFFFYDLETSGFSPRTSRIMQFAGQRTDMHLKPVGEPVNVLLKLTPDILPDPDAVLLTGITPQQTLADGLTEAEFLRLFYEKIVKPGTIFVGFNSIRFDDEFMRFLLYRNFYDAYEWHWQDSCSRWDLLDVVRMTRALRPEGIEWPFAPDGKPANRLELLTKVNKLDHNQAHDALSDVRATTAVAQLIQEKQPELFDYLLGLRDKQRVVKVVESGQPFVYTSGHYPSSVLHTTAVSLLAKHPRQEAALVYDLRYDPTPFLEMSPEQLAEAWKFSRDPDKLRLPVKTLKYNRCPAVAPLGVIKEKAAQQRIDLELAAVEKHRKLLRSQQAKFAPNVQRAVELLDEQRHKAQVDLVDNRLTVDQRLYDGFMSPADKKAIAVVRAAEPSDLTELVDIVKDERLKSLLPLYKARNYPAALTADESQAWEEFCRQQLFAGGQDSRLAQYFKRLSELAEGKLSGEKRYLLEELQLYGQSVMPADAA